MSKLNSPRSMEDYRSHAAAYISDIEEAQRLDRIEEEFRKAFDFLERLPKSVSIFGSSKSQPGSMYYEKARQLGARFASQDIAIVTGGGPGIMEAANRGALEAGGISAGLGIELATGEGHNHFTNRSMTFHYFFSRKTALSFAASMYIFFPGGFGTMDEFFELVTLVQSKKIQHIPIFCVGANYWEPLERFFDYYMLRYDHLIEPSDLKLYTITDDLELILEAAKHTHPQN